MTVISAGRSYVLHVSASENSVFRTALFEEGAPTDSYTDQLIYYFETPGLTESGEVAGALADGWAAEKDVAVLPDPTKSDAAWDPATGAAALVGGSHHRLKIAGARPGHIQWPWRRHMATTLLRSSKTRSGFCAAVSIHCSFNTSSAV